MASPVSALLLAAGSARRMGRLKQLLPLADRPAVCRCIDAISAAGISDIVAVVGHDAPEVASLMGPGARVVINMKADSEMAESVRIGLRAFSEDAGAILVCLADHPLVAPDTIRSVVAMGLHRPGSIVIPSCSGRRGHPCLFPRDVISGVFRGDTLRDIVRRHADSLSVIEVDDEGVILDMDTEDDYQRMLAYVAASDKGGL